MRHNKTNALSTISTADLEKTTGGSFGVGNIWNNVKQAAQTGWSDVKSAGQAALNLARSSDPLIYD